MLTLPKKLRKDSQEHNNNVPVKKISVRDRLLVKEVRKMCKYIFTLSYFLFGILIQLSSIIAKKF